MFILDTANLISTLKENNQTLWEYALNQEMGTQRQDKGRAQGTDGPVAFCDGALRAESEEGTGAFRKRADRR